jgi:acyl-coenzyme A synthetase/AMP-(fatty) acid ligase
VAAAVVRQEGEDVEEGELADFCRERLAGFKVPRKWRFLEELPRTESGKIRRRALKVADTLGK